MSEATLEQFYLFLNKIPMGMKGRKVDWAFNKGIIRGKRLNHLRMKRLAEFYSYYRSGHFSELGFQMYFLENFSLDDTFLNDLNKWSPRDVKNISKESIQTLIKKDQEFFLQVSNKTGVKDFQKYFDINSNGESLVFNFYEQGLISIQFLAKYCMYFVENTNETDKHKKIVKISKITKEIIQKTQGK